MGIQQVVAGQRITAQVINQLPVVVSYLTTGSVSNSTAETVIGTFTIPAGDPTFPGGYKWEFFGTAAETASPTLNIRVRLNGLTGTFVAGPGPLTVSVANSMIGITGKMGFAAIGTSGSFLANTIFDLGFNGTATLSGGLTQTPVAIDTTVANTIVITAQWSAASASNVATAVMGAMYRL